MVYADARLSAAPDRGVRTATCASTCVTGRRRARPTPCRDRLPGSGRWVCLAATSPPRSGWPAGRPLLRPHRPSWCTRSTGHVCGPRRIVVAQPSSITSATPCVERRPRPRRAGSWTGCSRRAPAHGGSVSCSGSPRTTTTLARSRRRAEPVIHGRRVGLPRVCVMRTWIRRSLWDVVPRDQRDTDAAFRRRRSSPRPWSRGRGRARLVAADRAGQRPFYAARGPARGRLGRQAPSCPARFTSGRIARATSSPSGRSWRRPARPALVGVFVARCAGGARDPPRWPTRSARRAGLRRRGLAHRCWRSSRSSTASPRSSSSGARCTPRSRGTRSLVDRWPTPSRRSPPAT